MNEGRDGEAGEDALLRRMATLGIREEDLRETFVRSGGHGDKTSTKVATCVQLVHLPRRAFRSDARRNASGAESTASPRAAGGAVGGLVGTRPGPPLSGRELKDAPGAARSAGAKGAILADKARQSARKGLRRRPGTE